MTTCNHCHPLCQCGAEAERQPVMTDAGTIMGVRILTCEHTSGRYALPANMDRCEAGICRVPATPAPKPATTAPYAEGDLDALLAAYDTMGHCCGEWRSGADYREHEPHHSMHRPHGWPNGPEFAWDANGSPL